MKIVDQHLEVRRIDGLRRSAAEIDLDTLEHHLVVLLPVRAGAAPAKHPATAGHRLQSRIVGQKSDPTHAGRRDFGCDGAGRSRTRRTAAWARRGAPSEQHRRCKRAGAQDAIHLLVSTVHVITPCGHLGNISCTWARICQFGANRA